MAWIKYFLVLSIIFIVTGCGLNEREYGAFEESIPGAEELTPIKYPQIVVDTQPDERLVKVVTSKGEVTIRLYPKYAPLAVENFLTHIENGYYDGVLFHHVLDGYMVQTGDPLGSGTGGESAFGEPFNDEFSPSLAHFRGAVSMANSGPNTNESQFFIVQRKTVNREFFNKSDITYPEQTISHYLDNGGIPEFDYNHTVFGQVIDGMDVLDKIASAPVGLDDRPVENILIEKMEILY